MQTPVILLKCLYSPLYVSKNVWNYYKIYFFFCYYSPNSLRQVYQLHKFDWKLSKNKMKREPVTYLPIRSKRGIPIFHSLLHIFQIKIGAIFTN